MHLDLKLLLMVEPKATSGGDILVIYIKQNYMAIISDELILVVNYPSVSLYFS